MVAELAVRLPAGSQLAIGSRQELPLPVPRLRAQGGLVELGTDDLAMDDAEAAVAARRRRRRVAEDERRGPRRPDRGMAGRPVPRRARHQRRRLAARTTGFTFTGDDRFMGDYLRSEFLDRVSRADVSFLTRTSILDRMSGPLCDARSSAARRSGRVLDRLERRNLLVIPLDRRGEWYRYHHLFRDLLHAELMRREPEMVPELHIRAASWYEANGLPEAAIEHAQQAGDADRVARLVLKHRQPGVGERAARHRAALDGVVRGRTARIEDHPAIAVHGALIYALIGQAGDAERWAAGGRAHTIVGRHRCPTATRWRARWRTCAPCCAATVVDEMRRDAQTALERAQPDQPLPAGDAARRGCRPSARRRPRPGRRVLRPGLGRGDQRRRRAVRAASCWPSAASSPIAARRLARGRVAGRRRRWRSWTTASSTTTGRARWSTPGLPAWRHGEATSPQARDLVARAARLRPLLTYALPVVSVQALLELARAYVALADPGGARAALRQINDIQQHRPELGTLPSQADELRSTRRHCSRGEMLGVVLADDRRAAAAAAAADPPVAGRDRRAALRLPQHGQVPGDLDLPQARRTTRGATIDRIHELGLLA